MSYELLIEDDTGDTVDALPVCSRGCAKDVAFKEDLPNEPYSYEPEFDTWCVNCGVIMGGFAIEDNTWHCRHRYPIIVNRFRVDVAEVCEHGVTIQQPSSNLEGTK